MRYFKNPYPDYNGSQVKVDTDKITDLVQEYAKTILNSKNVNDREDGGELYSGSSGIAFMFLQIYHNETTRSLLPESLRSAKLFIDHAKRSIGFLSHRKDHEKAAFLCGSAGIYSVSCVINKELNNIVISQEDRAHFLAGFPVCQNINYCPYGSDEILFGRAGYLSGIYWMNKYIHPQQQIPQEVIVKLCDVIIESGIQYSQDRDLMMEMMWECYGSKYLGAAHGICAILHMLLESPLFASEHLEELNEKQFLIKTCIDDFLKMQSADGNFPTVLEDAGKPEHDLVHWCHGAPGMIYLFAKSYLLFKDKKYLNACLKCGDLVWEKGLLKKGPGICHGVAGNGYVFLILYRLTDDPKHLYRASCFADFLTTETFIQEARRPDRPLSLYEGIAGTVCFLIDLLDPSKAQFPFMDVFGKTNNSSLSNY